MKVKYIGTATEVSMPGIGILNPGDVVDVPEKLGKQLVSRSYFVEVKPKRKKVKRRRYVPPPPPIETSAAEEPSVFSIGGR